MTNEECDQYLCTENNDWMTAISTDNVTQVDDILHNPHHPSTKSTLLHTQLPVLSPSGTANQRSTQKTCFLPFHFAVICHAKDVVRCMVLHGMDVTQIDDKGDNVYTLINLSKQQLCKDGEYIFDRYNLLKVLFSEHSIKFCLHYDDAKGLRPLELAASLDHLQLLNAMFHTPGVYLCTAEICGFQLVQYFRVTEYDKFSDHYLSNRHFRDHLSPLRSLLQLRHNSVDITVAKSALLCEPFATWILSKTELNIWCIMLNSSIAHIEALLFFFGPTSMAKYRSHSQMR